MSKPLPPPVPIDDLSTRHTPMRRGAIARDALGPMAAAFPPAAAAPREASAPVETPSAAEAVRRPAKRRERNFHIPDYLDRAVTMRAAERGTTRSRIVLEALRAFGFEVDEIDLVDLRGNPRGR